jgi:hypothetical protein
MRELGGFRDMLEDDVEMIHQIAGRFEARSSSIKSHKSMLYLMVKWKLFHIARRCRCISSNHR